MMSPQFTRRFKVSFAATFPLERHLVAEGIVEHLGGFLLLLAGREVPTKAQRDHRPIVINPGLGMGLNERIVRYLALILRLGQQPEAGG